MSDKCKSYQSDGTCKHFPAPHDKCPVSKADRGMFGEMEACEPVKRRFKV